MNNFENAPHAKEGEKEGKYYALSLFYQMLSLMFRQVVTNPSLSVLILPDNGFWN